MTSRSERAATIFESPSKSAAALERRIESCLREALGYEVATFLRTPAELSAVASHKPFGPGQLEAAIALNVGFLAKTLDERSRLRLLVMQTDIDESHVRGREIFWLC